MGIELESIRRDMQQHSSLEILPNFKREDRKILKVIGGVLLHPIV